MDFKDWTKEYQDVINGKTWKAIKTFYLPCDVWIDDYKDHGSRSKILIKLVLATKYDTELKDWDMNCIKNVAKTYSKIFKSIIFWLQHLQNKELEKI